MLAQMGHSGDAASWQQGARDDARAASSLLAVVQERAAALATRLSKSQTMIAELMQVGDWGSWLRQRRGRRGAGSDVLFLTLIPTCAEFAHMLSAGCCSG